MEKIFLILIGIVAMFFLMGGSLKQIKAGSLQNRFQLMISTLGNSAGAVQSRGDLSNTPLILSDESDVENHDIIQDENRTTDLLYGTVMAQIAASELWTPFVFVVGDDGSAVPRGIYLGDDIGHADLAAENIVDVPILVGNARVNEAEVIWDDDTLSPETVVAPGTVEARTARRALEESVNIRLEATVQTTDHEN